MSDNVLIGLARQIDHAIRRYAALTDLDECDALCERIDCMIKKAHSSPPSSPAGRKAKRKIGRVLRAIGGTGG